MASRDGGFIRNPSLQPDYINDQTFKWHREMVDSSAIPRYNQIILIKQVL